MTVRRLGFCLLVLSCLILSTATPGVAQTRLLRFPDLHGDRLVFTYAGDLWLAPVTGGTATRLTTHPGVELFGKFSPDGNTVAFTGQYDGDEQVYVIPADGGVPEQLTFYPASGPLPPRWGYDNQVYGWHPDGGGVLFRSMRDGWDLSDTQLYVVALDGGLPTALPMPVAGGGDFSPDGSKVVYSPLTRDFRAWKRYQGGWAQDLYIFDLATHDTEQITDDIRSDRDPMWIGNTVYFTSDRDGTLNLYAYEMASRSTVQLTHSDVWDVRWPSADPSTGRIVYELNGELQIYDTRSGSNRSLSVRVPTDALATRPSRVSAADAIENAGLSPKAKRALFAARGDIFTVPIEHGPTRNLTRSSGAHDREPAWSPDGSRIAFVSDASGEEEIWIVDQSGQGEAEQLTEGSTGRYYDLLWSPDGKHLAFRNQQAKLFVLVTSTKEVLEVADDKAPFGLDPSWSPNGGFLTFSLAEDNTLRSIWIWRAADRSLHRVTDELFNEFSPVFGAGGDYLFYLGDREFRPQVGSVEFDYVVDRETFIYALGLRKDVANPFPPRSDEETVDGDGEEDDDDGEDDSDKKGKNDKKDKKDKKGKDDDEAGSGDESKEPIVIELAGLADRVARVPLDAENIVDLAAVEDGLVYIQTGAAYYGRQSDQNTSMRFYSLEDRESLTLAEDISSLTISDDGKKALVQSGGTYQLLDVSASGKDSGKPVSTAGLAVDRDPTQEWAQIFDEVWRRFRDFFYVENMHGYDWSALRERYRPLLEHVGHRSDLNYVLSEMIAELSVSHAYVSGGDFEIPDRPTVALLGARFDLDADADRYRLSDIFAGHNEETRYRAPLTEIGVDANVGDYVLRINGVDLAGSDNPYRLLRHAGGGPVELTVNDRPTLDGARHLLVEPIRSEDSLIYLTWVERNRKQVLEQTDGRVGYIHLPDMGVTGLAEWIKWYYGQIRKQGLIIDVRSNGGGNVSQMILNRLTRDLLMMDFERNVDYPDTYPNKVFYGHLVSLIDEDTASDGDQFAYVFREAGLGPLIGKRTWGGVVGIYGRGQLIDGGSMSVPEAGSGSPRGEWVIEGHGVEPDIVVENEPKAVLEGRDPQLEKAIEVMLAKLVEDPRVLPEAPEAPVKVD